jgi:hypothetical protein
LETSQKISCEACSSTLNPVSEVEAEKIIRRKLQDFRLLLTEKETLTTSALQKITENTLKFKENLEKIQNPSLQEEIKHYESSIQKSFQEETSAWLSLQQLIRRRLEWVEGNLLLKEVNVFTSLVALETWSSLDILTEPKEYTELHLWHHPSHRRYPSLLSTNGWCVRPTGKVIELNSYAKREIEFEITGQTFTFLKVSGLVQIKHDDKVIFSCDCQSFLTTRGFLLLKSGNWKTEITFYSLETGDPVIYHSNKCVGPLEFKVFDDTVLVLEGSKIKIYHQDHDVVEIEILNMGSPIGPTFLPQPYYKSENLCCLKYWNGLVTIDMSTLEITESPVQFQVDVDAIISLPGINLPIYNRNTPNRVTSDKILDFSPDFQGNIYVLV